MPKKIDLKGQKFGKLFILEETNIRKNGGVVWKCQCDCGNICLIRQDNIKNGITKSCGCFHKETSTNQAKTLNYKHGHKCNRKITGTYHSWHGIKQRCENHNHKFFNYYGGRGIICCERWKGKNGFINFLEDMGERPINMSLDRIDNDGNYEPSNCRWVDKKTQSQNRRWCKK